MTPQTIFFMEHSTENPGWRLCFVFLQSKELCSVLSLRICYKACAASLFVRISDLQYSVILSNAQSCLKAQGVRICMAYILSVTNLHSPRVWRSSINFLRGPAVLFPWMSYSHGLIQTLRILIKCPKTESWVGKQVRKPSVYWIIFPSHSRGSFRSSAGPFRIDTGCQYLWQ